MSLKPWNFVAIILMIKLRIINALLQPGEDRKVCGTFKYFIYIFLKLIAHEEVLNKMILNLRDPQFFNKIFYLQGT